MTVIWNEVTIWWNEVTKGWNEVAWNEVVMERSDCILERNESVSYQWKFPSVICKAAFFNQLIYFLLHLLDFLLWTIDQVNI